MGVCRDIYLGLPKLSMPIGMKQGFGEGLRDSLSLEIVIPVVIPLAPGRYFSERGDAVAKASKETHVVST